MNTDQESATAFAVISAIIFIAIIWIVLSRLAAIKKEQQKTNFLLVRKMRKEGHEFSDDDLRYLNS